MMGIVFVFNVHQTDSSYTYDSWTVLWNSYPLVSTQFYERYFTIYKNIILVLSFSHQGHLRYISKHIYRHYFMKALCKLISSPTRFCRQKFWLLWVYLPLPHLPIIWQMYSIYFFPTDQFLHINKFQVHITYGIYEIYRRRWLMLFIKYPNWFDSFEPSLESICIISFLSRNRVAKYWVFTAFMHIIWSLLG